MQFNYQIRIGDINYGNHLAHDKLITLLHDARSQFLEQLNQSEHNFLGVGLILTDLSVKYLQQAMLHDALIIQVKLLTYTAIKIELTYTVLKKDSGDTIATADTRLLFFDYQKQKVHRLSNDKLDNLLATFIEN